MQTETTDTENLEPPSSFHALGQAPAYLSSIPPASKPARKKPKIIHFAKTATASHFTVSPRCEEFRKHFFPQTTLAEWNDWRWQFKNRIKHVHELSRFLTLSEDEKQIAADTKDRIPLAITPYFASLLERDNPQQPLRRTVVPTTAELRSSAGEATDPLGETHDEQAAGVIHRYPDRVLFLVAGNCFANCRYCTRSRVVGSKKRQTFDAAQWEKGLAYIEGNPVVRDVLISGGDPLTLSDEKLESLLSRLSRIPHVEFIRIGSKAPVVMPQRITPALTRMLKKYHPLWMSLHFTHPDELTPEVKQACERLADAGVPLGSQTVLLAGINGNVATMKQLFHGLLKIRVKPYYLYQCDPITGSAHFRTPVEKGLEIIRGLRGFTSGYAVPSYVIDAPGGGGKIPLLPEYVVGRDGDDLLLKNYEGQTYRYPDPLGNTELGCKESAS